MSQSQSRWRIALLAALSSIGALSTSIYTPSMPALGTALNATPGEVQLTLSAFLAGFAVMQLVYGPLSDRFGRRPTLAVGLVIYTVSSLGCAFAGSIDALIALRFLQAVGGCAGAVISRAVVRDLFEPVRAAQVMAIVAIALSLAPAVGPALGGYLQVHFGWASTFYAVAAAGAVLFLLSRLSLPETQAGAHRELARNAGARALLTNYRQLLASPTYLAYSGIVGGLFAAMFAYVAASPELLITHVGLTPDVYGLYAIVIVFGMMAGGLASRRLVARVGIPGMVHTGVAIAVVGVGLMLAAALMDYLTVFALFGAMTVFMFGAGFITPNAMAGAISEFPHIAGTASAFIGFVQMAAGMAGSMLVAVVPLPLYPAMAVVMMAMVAIAALLALWQLRHRRTVLAAER
jgi:DHA1 family bicyclomycin/chloramphenicol resistance-like MFS transporter